MKHRPPLFRDRRQGYAVDAHRPLLKSIEAGKISFHALGRSHYPGVRLRRGRLPGLLSLGFWDANGDQDWGMDFHRNEGLEICFLETGSLQFAVDDDVFPLGPGYLTITRPWQAHRQGSPCIAAGRLHWVTLSVRALRPDQPWHWPSWIVLAPEDRAELARRLRQTQNTVWRASPDLIRSFTRMARMLRSDPGDRCLSTMAVGVNDMLLGVLQMLREENLSGRASLATIEHTMELFLRDLKGNLGSLEKHWTLKSMAAACGIGTTQFSQFCRRLTNDSPVRYLNLARLDAAARLLRQDRSRKITEIAFDCGFQSSQYFAYQFQRRFKQTPTAYRRGLK